MLNIWSHAWDGISKEQLENDRTYNPNGVILDDNKGKGNPIGFYDDQTDNYRQTHYQLLFNHIFSPAWNLNIAFHYTNGFGYYQEYKNGRTLKEYGLKPFYLPDNSEPQKKTNLVRQKLVDSDFGGGIFSLNYQNERLNASLGGGLNRYSNDHIQPRVVGDETFSTVVLTLDGKVALLQDFPTPEKNGALLVEIHEDVLLHFLEQSLGDTGVYMEILDPSGAPIFSVGSYSPSETQAETFTGHAGWSFQLWQDPSQTKLSPLDLLQLIGIWLLIFGAVSLAAAVAITLSIYRPIRILRSAVETVEHGGGENELEVVRRVYEDTLRQKVSLSQEVAEMAPIVRERLYKNLLRGKELPETYLLDRLAYLHSPFQPDGIFAVLAGAVDDSYDGNPDELMGDLYRRLSQELQPSVSCQPYSCEYLLMDDYSLVLILAFPHSASAAQINAAELEQSKIVQEYARQNHVENLFTLGRGKPCRGITNLHYSYVEALESLNYQHYHGSGAEEEQDQQSGCRQCVELAKSGDIDGAKRAFDVLLQEAAHAAAGSLSPLENCSAMLDCMVEALLNLHVPEEKLALFESYYRRAEHQTGSELFVLASRVGTEGLSLLAYYGQKNRNRYVAQAQKYIQERCVDSHLSLEMVADSVGITPAYLSRLFYELSEVNFVNYVNECRVQRAKLLLRQSKIPVQEVGFRCGFNSLQNFNRVFKRHTGTTPGAYRKQ